MRVSTEEQARFGVSLDSQAERIRAYCLSAGLDLAELVTEDGVSGTKKLETRPGGTQLLASKHEHVVALKLDRLFRDAEDALNQTRRWDRAGIALHVIDMGGQALNTASAMGRMFLTMTAAFAELERNLIAERTASALGHKKRQHKAYSPTPFGFSRDGKDLVHDAAELDVVKRIRRWEVKGWSQRAIAEELNRLQVPTKRGGLQWYASTVGKILANSIHG